MAKIIVLGAGLGGLPAAYELRKTLGSSHSITVINENPFFSFVPSNPWIFVGWRTKDQVTCDLQLSLAKRDIQFIPSVARLVKPEEKAVLLENGQSIDFDFLVITTGPKLAFDEIPGLGPDAYSHSVCLLSHAQKANAHYQKFLEKPGPVVIGAVQGASCFGPAYELAMIIDTDLRKKKLRDKVPMTFVSSEPYIGHLGLGGVADSKGILESEFRKRDIRMIVNSKIQEVKAEEVVVNECGPDGKDLTLHHVQSSLTMFIPAFKGVDAVAAVKDMCNPRGFVITDQFQKNPKYPFIYSAGVCVALAPKEPTPVPTGVPKTGYMIESMASAVVQNIKSNIEGKEPKVVASMSAVCLADMGDRGVAFVAIPQVPPRNIAWAKGGKWVHIAKILFEKYFLRKMRKGVSEPLYEKLVLRRLGVRKMK